MIRPRLPVLMLGLLTAASACGTSTLDLGRNAPDASPGEPSSPAPDESLPGEVPGASTWEWLNPAPQGNRIRGVGGSSDDDVWLVGDSNTVLHWDGERWADLHGSLRGLDLYSVWSSGPNDVWVAGDAGVSYRHHPESASYSRHPNEGGGAILHFDGHGWKVDPRIGTRWAHAIWGTDATHVFALLENGDVGRFDGKDWTITAAPAGAVLREVWGTSATDVWAVGDRGTIAHFDGTGWSTVTRGSGDPHTDPASSKIGYYGVWGSSANDVWAVFRDPTPAGSNLQTTGFAHWDGSAWTVAQALLTHESQAELYAPQTDAPFRLGHQLWGGDGKRALAMVAGTFEVLAFDGTAWTVEDALSTAGLRTLWGRPGVGALFAAGEGGSLFRFDGAAPVETRLTNVFPGFRQSIRSIVSVGDDVWGIALDDAVVMPADAQSMGDLVRWTTGGWSRVRPQVKQADGTSCDVAVGAIAVAGANDVWIAGAHATSCVPLESYNEQKPDLLHWDGSAWTAVDLPAEEANPFYGTDSAHVWIAEGSKSPWLIARKGGPLYRANNKGWTLVPLPDGHRAGAIGGASETEVWVTSASKGSEALDYLAVFRLQGDRFEEAHRVSGYNWSCDVVVAAPNDVWIRGNPGLISSPNTLIHWDGQGWTDRHDLNAEEVWAAGDGKAYFLSNDAEGADRMFAPADVRHVLGYWDGAKKTLLGETSASVRALTATKDGLWVAGEGGATLRYSLAKSPR